MSSTPSASADDLHRLAALASVMQTSSPRPAECVASKHKTAMNPLDAIALLCVQNAKADVFAVAVQIAYDPLEIVLTIAGNAGVPQETANHISALWGHMKHIGRCVRDRMPVADTVESPYAPHKRANHGMYYYRKLRRDVYCFSFDTVYRLLTKRHEAETLRRHLQHTGVFAVLAVDPVVRSAGYILFALLKIDKICARLAAEGKLPSEAIDIPCFLELMGTIWSNHSYLSKTPKRLARLDDWALSAGGLFSSFLVLSSIVGKQ